MVFYFSVLSMAYCLLLGWLYIHWQRIPANEPASAIPDNLPPLTVIIPVRNEAAMITYLLQDLAKQTNASDSRFPFEVIIVDDASTDDTARLVREFQPTAPFALRLLSLDVPADFEGSHKKLALQQAIDAAEGDIIVTTDGDCRVGPQWLFTIRQFFTQHQLVLLSGPVTFHGETSLFEHLQTVEFASLIGTGAACLHARRPNMANGANLAFLRSAFFAVNGYAGTLHIPSGDDEFLLQKLAHRYPNRLRFLKTSAAVVRTEAQKTVGDFYQQRKRWASKWKLHRNYYVAGLAVFIFTYHASWLVIVALALAGKYSALVLLAQLFPKLILECLFLRSVLALLQKPLRIGYFLVLQLIYAPYAVFFGMRANFGGYTWKNRPYN